MPPLHYVLHMWLAAIPNISQPRCVSNIFLHDQDDWFLKIRSPRNLLQVQDWSCVMRDMMTLRFSIVQLQRRKPKCRTSCQEVPPLPLSFNTWYDWMVACVEAEIRVCMSKNFWYECVQFWLTYVNCVKTMAVIQTMVLLGMLNCLSAPEVQDVYGLVALRMPWTLVEVVIHAMLIRRLMQHELPAGVSCIEFFSGDVTSSRIAKAFQEMGKCALAFDISRHLVLWFMSVKCVCMWYHSSYIWFSAG